MPREDNAGSERGCVTDQVPDLGLHEGKGGEEEKKCKVCSSIIHTLFSLLSDLAFLLRETFIWNVSDIYKYREDSTLR